MNVKLFGTDGIRGLANEYPMTSEVSIEIGRALAHVLRQERLKSVKKERRLKIVVGKDTRLSGYMIEYALTSGLCSMGADVILIGPLSTPGVAFVTQSMRADAGVMISASHNPYYDNGLKIFLSDGFKLPDVLELELERLVLSKELSQIRPVGDEIGRVVRIDDVYGRCIVYLKSLFPKDLDLVGVRIVLDCAHGASYKIAPQVFEELGAEVICFGVDPNGCNINDKCGALYPSVVCAKTIEYRADIGIALDGDGDRCILSDEMGEIVDGDQIVGLCALDMATTGDLLGAAVVTTPMSNLGLEQTLSEKGIRLIKAPVGDRHVVEAMKKNGLNLGGEQSGHVVFLDHATTGDGVIAALKVLAIMRRQQKTLSQLKDEIKIYPQVRVNIKTKQKVDLNAISEIALLIQEIESQLADQGRVFVRYSGTEPVIRVLLEGNNLKQIQGFAKRLEEVIVRNVV